jgi:hypothetical protein
MNLPATTKRVALHTDDEKNRKISKEMEYRLWYYLHHPDEIKQRLLELDKEWDIERTLEANAASFALAGLFLGATVSRKFFLFPTVVMSFLLQHALQGWCPPVPVFRGFGVRTQSEIELERYSLKALRGDFVDIPEPSPVDREQSGKPEKVLQAMSC